MARTAGAAFAANAVMLDPDAYGKSAFSLAVSPPRAVPPSDTIRFGMIGVGMQGLVRSETMRAYGREDMERILQRLP